MIDDPDDVDLELRPSDSNLGPRLESDGPSPFAPSRGLGPGSWAAILIGVALIAGGSFWVLRPPRTVPSAPGPAAAPPTVAPSSAPPPLVLPPLDGSDALVRDLAKALSSHSLFALGLAQKELIRTVAAVILNVAEGESPRAHLGFLAPKSGFLVVERRSGRLFLDPASYARYDPLGEAAASLDADQAARVYRLLEPLFESAYRELGHGEGGFRTALQRALAKLLEVPLLEGEVPLVQVEKTVVLYEFFDERIEGLSIPQKHLLRMGPRNVARIQEKLRGLAQALELP